jgi:hypothetical protein
MVISGVAPLIVYAFRRVRRSASIDAFQTGDVGRASVLPSEDFWMRALPLDQRRRAVG